MVLYYQPKIVVNEGPENGIELYRADAIKKNGALYPDFIIKKVEYLEKGTKIKYSILDSKWSTKETLADKKTFENTIYKYYFSIIGKDAEGMLDMHPISNLWLINGKDSKNSQNEIYYHLKNKQFNDNLNLKHRAGIVSLTPDCKKNNFKDLKEVIQFIVNH